MKLKDVATEVYVFHGDHVKLRSAATEVYVFYGDHVKLTDAATEIWVFNKTCMFFFFPQGWLG